MSKGFFEVLGQIAAVCAQVPHSASWTEIFVHPPEWSASGLAAQFSGKTKRLHQIGVFRDRSRQITGIEVRRIAVKMVMRLWTQTGSMGLVLP
jgi:hypothetical protein